MLSKSGGAGRSGHPFGSSTGWYQSVDAGAMARPSSKSERSAEASVKNRWRSRRGGRRAPPRPRPGRPVSSPRVTAVRRTLQGTVRAGLRQCGGYGWLLRFRPSGQPMVEFLVPDMFLRGAPITHFRGACRHPAGLAGKTAQCTRIIGGSLPTFWRSPGTRDSAQASRSLCAEPCLRRWKATVKPSAVWP